MIAQQTAGNSRAPLLAYDGDCSMCIRSIRSLKLLGLLGGIDTQAATLVTGDDRALLDKHRRSGEIGLLDSQRADVLTGAAAFRWLLQRRLPRVLGAFLDLPPLFLVMCIGYRSVAAWRRLLSPPASAPDPTFPEPRWVARYRLIGSIVLIALLYWLVPLILGEPVPSDPSIQNTVDKLPLLKDASILLLVGTAILLGLISHPGRAVDTLASLVGAIFVSSIALTLLALWKQNVEGTGNPLLEPWGIIAGSSIWGFVFLFRCRNWLAGDRTDSGERWLIRMLRSKVTQLVVLTAILGAWLVWFEVLYNLV
ncbi:MAG: DCC1-like thiol-disulfide oxidoreductase family protein [Planctomycetota bacterium]